MLNDLFKIIKGKDILVIFPVFLLISWGKSFKCIGGINFDAQSFQFWNYTHNLDLIPYKDFFYPYGLLSYLRIDNIFWQFVSLLLLFLILFSMYLISKLLFKKTSNAFIFFISSCLYILLFLDYESILRYLPLFIFVSITLLSIYGKNFLSKINGLITGLVLGLYFSFINDIFIYSALSLGVFTIIFLLTNGVKSKQLIHFFVYFFIGFTIGSLPIAYYLFQHNAIGDFLMNYILIKDIALYAKVPFPPTLKSIENILTIWIISVSIISVVNKYRGNKKTTVFYFQILLTLLLIILEQKNVIRSNYVQLSVFGFALLGSLLTNFKNKKYLSLFLLIFIFIVFMDRNFRNSNLPFIWVQNSKCSTGYPADYLRVRQYLDAIDKGAKVFSYPGDSVFYKIFDQRPPYYPSIYESTPRYAQERQINFIYDNKINYVILNTRSASIQDGVPDQARSKYLFSYILDNFKFDKKIGSFEVFVRKK